MVKHQAVIAGAKVPMYSANYAPIVAFGNKPVKDIHYIITPYGHCCNKLA